ncbi:hypothetical protein LX64_01398 [Chitinophaga skermanii]|uniref:3-keto-disaccharide hydrolase domain-containing protein n=1 Tax=Chitinophaga skermanii TaxID=331697 RepID=A0A327QYE5_9BACT|nr:hypothetical protein [Chitinophaga skermanii]RAJ08744.1 hypothetical protein LX64_01398 [Chitinophaga skermanii]
MKRILAVCLFCLVTHLSSAQKISLLKSYEAKQLEIVNREPSIVNNGNEPIFRLNEQPGGGLAWLKDQVFTTGTISFDVKGRDVQQKSFVGVAFQGINDTTYDAIYLRPFNFNAAEPIRRLRAVQYISLPENDWEPLREKFPNVYENAVTPVPNATDWVHVDIVVTETGATVYINHSKTASLKVTLLQQRGGKRIALWVGNNSDGEWRNFELKKN